MKTTGVSFRMDAELKKQTEEIMQEVGMNMSTAFTVFCKAVVRNGGLPMELLVDPFYRAENLNEIKRRISEYESGKVRLERTTMEELESEIYG